MSSPYFARAQIPFESLPRSAGGFGLQDPEHVQKGGWNLHKSGPTSFRFESFRILDPLKIMLLQFQIDPLMI